MKSYYHAEKKPKQNASRIKEKFYTSKYLIKHFTYNYIILKYMLHFYFHR